MHLVVVPVLWWCSLAVQGVYLEPSRTRRGIWGTVTSTVYQTVEEKHYVPASCVRITPGLPGCRNVRFMRYPSFDADAFNFFNIGNELFPTSATDPNKTAIATNITKRADVNIPGSTKQLQGWGEYLGLYRSTVTVTALKIQPTTVLDQRIMVTYDIREGCIPHEVPYNLPKCVEDNSFEITEVIIPTTTIKLDVQPTQLPEIPGNPEEVQGSETLVHHQQIHGSTQTL